MYESNTTEYVAGDCADAAPAQKNSATLRMSARMFGLYVGTCIARSTACLNPLRVTRRENGSRNDAGPTAGRKHEGPCDPTGIEVASRCGAIAADRVSRKCRRNRHEREPAGPARARKV